VFRTTQQSFIPIAEARGIQIEREISRIEQPEFELVKVFYFGKIVAENECYRGTFVLLFSEFVQKEVVMGSLSNAMQRLVGDIGSSAESRHVNISEMLSNSRNLLERFRLERQDMASTLDEKLSSDNTANKEATQQFINSVKADLQNMAKALDEKLSSDNTANKEATKQFMNSVKADFQNMAKALNDKLSSENHNLLERFRLERHDMASTLNDKLSSDNTANKEATKQYLNSVMADLQNMAKSLDDKLSLDNTANKEATKQFINSVMADLQNMAKALDEKLSSDNTANKEATKQFINSVKADLQNMAKALDEKLSLDNTANKKAAQQFINELVSDRGAAQRIWRKSFWGVVEKQVQPIIEVAVEEPVQSVVVKETVVESPAQFVAEVAVEEQVQPVIEEEAEPFPEKQILEVIAGHPGGIKLVDIGNELGVDWRSLIGNIKPLVDSGKIDKIENLYYPRS